MLWTAFQIQILWIQIDFSSLCNLSTWWKRVCILKIEPQRRAVNIACFFKLTMTEFFGEAHCRLVKNKQEVHPAPQGSSDNDRNGEERSCGPTILLHTNWMWCWYLFPFLGTRKSGSIVLWFSSTIVRLLDQPIPMARSRYLDNIMPDFELLLTCQSWGNQIPWRCSYANW